MMVPSLTLNSSPAFVPGLCVKDTVDSRWSCLSGHPCSAGGAGEPGAAPQQVGRRPAGRRPAHSRRLHSAAGAAGKTSATRGPRPPQLCLLLFRDLCVHTRAPVCLPPHWPCCQLFSGSVAPSSPVRLPSVPPPYGCLQDSRMCQWCSQLEACAVYQKVSLAPSRPLRSAHPAPVNAQH